MAQVDVSYLSADQILRGFWSGEIVFPWKQGDCIAVMQDPGSETMIAFRNLFVQFLEAQPWPPLTLRKGGKA
jgi:hypothetical protein